MNNLQKYYFFLRSNHVILRYVIHARDGLDAQKEAEKHVEHVGRSSIIDWAYLIQADVGKTLVNEV